MTILRLCERKGWTLGFFYDLPLWEQEAWFAFEIRRQKEIDDMRQALIDRQPHSLFSAEVAATLLAAEW